MVEQKKAVMPRVMTRETHELIKDAIIKGSRMQDACDKYGVTKEVYLAFDATVIAESLSWVSNAEKLRIVQAVDEERKEGFSTAEACLLVNVKPHQYYHYRRSLGATPAPAQIVNLPLKLEIPQSKPDKPTYVGMRRSSEEKAELIKRVEESMAMGMSRNDASRSAGIGASSYAIWKTDLELAVPGPEPKKPEQPPVPEPSGRDTTNIQRSHEEKQRLVALVDDYIKQGMGVKRACVKVGVPDPSYRTWKVQSTNRSETSYPGIHRTPEERSALVRLVDGFLEEGFSRRESCVKVGVSPISYDAWKSKERRTAALVAEKPTPPSPEAQSTHDHYKTWSKSRLKEVLLMIEQEYVDGTDVLQVVHRRHGMTPGFYYKALATCRMKSPTKKRENLGLIPIRSVIGMKRRGGEIHIDPKQAKEMRTKLLEIEEDYLSNEERIATVLERHGMNEGVYSRSLAKCKMISAPAKRAKLGRPSLSRVLSTKKLNSSNTLTIAQPRRIYRYLPWAAMALFGAGHLVWVAAAMSK